MCYYRRGYMVSAYENNLLTSKDDINEALTYINEDKERKERIGNLTPSYRVNSPIPWESPEFIKNCGGRSC